MPDSGLNMTPMIDIVFQLILFFLFNLRFKSLDYRIESSLPKDRGLIDSPSPVPELPHIKVTLFRLDGEDPTKARTKLKVDHVFFYTWASVYTGFIFKWTGLYVYHRGSGQDVFQEKPAYQAYVSIARSGEGCSKSTAGQCAR